MLMNDKIMFDRYYCMNSTKHCENEVNRVIHSTSWVIVLTVAKIIFENLSIWEMVYVW